MRTLFIIAVLVTAGCGATNADPAAYWRGRGYAVVQAAVVTFAESAPDPSPTPIPEGECSRCRGTGRIKPDGRIEIDCPDCGGDGITDPPAASTPPPPQPEPTATSSNNDNEADSSPPEAPALVWLDLLGDAKAQSRETGKPILVHFCYEGCLPCAEMDREVFTDPRVIEALDAFVLLRVDVLAPWGSIDQTCASAWSKAAEEPLTQCPRESILQADGQFVAPKGKRFVKPPADADGYLKYLDSLTKKGR